MAAPVWPVQQEIHLKAEADHAHKNAHRGEAILLPCVRFKKCENEQSERSHQEEPRSHMEGGRDPVWDIGKNRFFSKEINFENQELLCLQVFPSMEARANLLFLRNLIKDLTLTHRTSFQIFSIWFGIRNSGTFATNLCSIRNVTRPKYTSQSNSKQIFFISWSYDKSHSQGTPSLLISCGLFCQETLSRKPWMKCHSKRSTLYKFGEKKPLIFCLINKHLP